MRAQAVLYPGVRVTPCLSAVLADEDRQGAVIAAPAGLHYPIARQVIAAGKDLLAEKPLALTTARGGI